MQIGKNVEDNFFISWNISYYFQNSLAKTMKCCEVSSVEYISRTNVIYTSCQLKFRSILAPSLQFKEHIAITGVIQCYKIVIRFARLFHLLRSQGAWTFSFLAVLIVDLRCSRTYICTTAIHISLVSQCWFFWYLRWSTWWINIAMELYTERHMY